MCITAFLTVVLHGQVPPALAGLALAYAAHISGVFQYTTRLVSETEVRFISVERINSYIRVRYIVFSIILTGIMPVLSLLTLNSVPV
jgi:ATP-binding cassette subfamily C (CFTR/MRP) protein 5